MIGFTCILLEYTVHIAVTAVFGRDHQKSIILIYYPKNWKTLAEANTWKKIVVLCLYYFFKFYYESN